ncbi:MAG: hypothetical protein CSA21_05450 [Deltaproteobacteria bacterium]|nr:MAG: hypothetical protein CSA21_05450 [Deltaproteobacteria bacterium]
MIHDLKFRGQLNVLSSMACLIERSGVLSEFTVPDLILPVPLHTARLRERGYNQALLLARALFPGPYRRRIAPFILQRHRYTAAQSQLTGRTRRQNLRGAFCLSSQQSIAGTAVLLIDDVFTTGATLHECAKVLKQGGCTTVEALSFARSLGAPANSAATT